MKNRITACNEHRSSARSSWFAKHSHAAGVLLSGWFFFWIVGIVQPCCMAIAGAHDDGHATSQPLSAAVDAYFAGAAGSRSHQNEECPLAFTADTALPRQDFSLPATTDYTPNLAVVSHATSLLAVANFSNPLKVYHPSPPPRIYLRTLRLRI